MGPVTIIPFQPHTILAVKMGSLVLHSRSWPKKGRKMNDDAWCGLLAIILLSWWCPFLLVFSVWKIEP